MDKTMYILSCSLTAIAKKSIGAFTQSTILAKLVSEALLHQEQILQQQNVTPIEHCTKNICNSNPI